MLIVHFSRDTRYDSWLDRNNQPLSRLAVKALACSQLLGFLRNKLYRQIELEELCPFGLRFNNPKRKYAEKKTIALAFQLRKLRGGSYSQSPGVCPKQFTQVL